MGGVELRMVFGKFEYIFMCNLINELIGLVLLFLGWFIRVCRGEKGSRGAGG